MNVSQHCFVPLTQKDSRKGYYNASGIFVSNGNYSSYPILHYPLTPTVNSFQTFENFATIKLRSWTTLTPNANSGTAYSVESNTVNKLNSTVKSWTAPGAAGDYSVRLLMLALPVDSLSSVNLSVTPIDTELI